MPYVIESLGKEPEVPSTGLGEVSRGILATPFRAAETALGTPGSIAKTAQSIVQRSPVGQLGGFAGPGTPVGAAGQLLSSVLPSTEQLRGVTKAVTGEALEPKSETGKFWDDVVSDVTSLLLPGGKRVPLKGAIGRSLLGNIGAWGARELGAGPLGEAGAKLGFMALAGLQGGRQALTNQMRSQYEKADELAIHGLANAEKLDKQVGKILQQTYAGIPTPSKDFLRKTLIGLESNISAGRIPVPQVIEVKRNINSLLSDPSTPKEAKKFLGEVGKEIRSILEDYGSKNKEFARNFNAAEDIWKGLNTQSQIRNWIQTSDVADKIKNPLTKYLILGGGAYHYGIPTALATVGAVKLADKSLEALELLSRSKEARNYYAHALKSATQQNSKAFLRDIQKLDKIAERDEKKESKSVPSSGRFVIEKMGQ